MNVLAIVPDLKAPSCRFRILQYVEPLAARSIHLAVREITRNKRQRWRMFDAAGDYDAVLLHRKLLNRFDYSKLRRKARSLIYDFDDAVMFRDSNAPRQNSRMREKKFQRLVSGADLVIAGNKYLSRWAGRYTRRILEIPTVVDLAPYPCRPASGPGKVIGWMGTKSNFIYLREVLPALESLTRRRTGLRFVVVGDGLLDLCGVPFVSKNWSKEEEVPDLLGFDVGIMPLIPDPWTKGKCALKIIQYFAAFLPVVCSPVGANREVVRDGTNGYFARSPEEWENKLEELLNSPERREQMGRAGRMLVEEEYNLKVMVPRLAKVLKGAVA